MKIVFVVDSISDINAKINNMRSHFGDNILYVVQSNLVTLFETFNHAPNATYSNKNLIEVIHSLLSRGEVDDTIIYYSSLNLNEKFMTLFAGKVANRMKVVNVVPKYNAFEKFENSMYNSYVKALFKIKDSLASPKLQYLPKLFVQELLATHLGNRLFELDSKVVTNIYVENKEMSKNLKETKHFNSNNLISIICALVITIGLILCLVFTKMGYLIYLLFVFLYILDLFITAIMNYKSRFDQRFLR